MGEQSRKQGAEHDETREAGPSLFPVPREGGASKGKSAEGGEGVAEGENGPGSRHRPQDVRLSPSGRPSDGIQAGRDGGKKQAEQKDDGGVSDHARVSTGLLLRTFELLHPVTGKQPEVVGEGDEGAQGALEGRQPVQDQCEQAHGHVKEFSNDLALRVRLHSGSAPDGAVKSAGERASKKPAW